MSLKRIITLLSIALLPSPAYGGSIWQWTHNAAGSGMANVNDGGPPDFDSDATAGLDDDRMSFYAWDPTQSGSFGADAAGGGGSRILDATEERFRFWVDLTAGYSPSVFPGGDNPGGTAEAELFSVIEFVMPQNELIWIYGLDIDNLPPNPFSGSTDILVENVTRSQVLAHLTVDLGLFGVETTLRGTAGDLIRITSMISGSGRMGPGSAKRYRSFLQMVFDVPEPSTLLLLLLTLPLTRKQGSRIQ